MVGKARSTPEVSAQIVRVQLYVGGSLDNLRLRISGQSFQLQNAATAANHTRATVQQWPLKVTKGKLFAGDLPCSAGETSECRNVMNTSRPSHAGISQPIENSTIATRFTTDIDQSARWRVAIFLKSSGA